MNTTPYEAVIARLREHGREIQERADGTAMAQCPAHDDRKPSLSLKRGEDGRALIKCHAGCETEAVVKALGMKMADLMPAERGGGGGTEPKQAKRKEGPSKVYGNFIDARNQAAATLGVAVDQWDYQNACGQVVLRVVRFEPAEGSKEYRPYHPAAGGWALGDPDGLLPLYRLPELATAKRVYVCEGEKAADAARTLGLVATTSAHGAKAAAKTDWQPMAGKEVVILPDKDDAGEGYARDVAKNIKDLAASVRIVKLPGLAEGGDIADWLEEWDSIEPETLRAELEAMVDRARALDPADFYAGLKTVNFADVEPEETKWLWPGVIPLGKLSMIAGPPGLGKSFVTLDVAARVSRGDPWPGYPETSWEPGDVLLLAHEDGVADTIRPRLDAAGANVERIRLIQAAPRPGDDAKMFCLATDIHKLEGLLSLKPGSVKLIIIDPITNYLGDVDGHNAVQIRSVMTPLVALAHEYKVAILLVQHHNKTQGATALEKVSGSAAFTGVARTCFTMIRDKADKDRRLLLPAKNNLAKDVSGWAFRLVDSNVPGVARVEWEPMPVEITADEAMQQANEEGGTLIGEVAEWLKEFLADGPVPSVDVFAEGKTQGFSEKALRRAQKHLGIKSEKASGYGKEGKWTWRLPEQVEHAKDSKDGLSEKAGIFEGN